MDITVRYSSIDRFRETRRFKTIGGASAYARRWLGNHYEVAPTTNYAVSGDGIGKITVTGARITDLFPDSSTEEGRLAIEALPY